MNYMGEKIAANYFRGREAVGGFIYFDEAGILFKSHKLNIQRGETRIEYAEIAEVKKIKTLGLVPNGICIITNDGFEHKFVVYKRNLVIDFINSMICK